MCWCSFGKALEIALCVLPIMRMKKGETTGMHSLANKETDNAVIKCRYKGSRKENGNEQASILYRFHRHYSNFLCKMQYQGYQCSQYQCS